VLLAAACSLGSLDKVHIGRWIATRTFGQTDDASAITPGAALDVARRKLTEFERSPDHPFEPGLALTDPVAAGFVPSMVRLDAADGSSSFTTTLAADSWVFEFGQPGRGVIVVVDADRGTVSSASAN
jgi:hypothetical protein